ncbi:DnaB-like helicase N-terminal domain-containing protein [Streptomyces sp. NPDC002574]|uniref:DnaB-like helicase N-terminal domain-containing protein n=1 Tax=Streptomyces sp. NPDC002574 TaxID=3364652 RepID=UPI0036C56319
MSKTLIGTPDPDQPPPVPALCDEHAERMVLAAYLHDRRYTRHLMMVLRATCFSSPVHKNLYGAMDAVHRRNEPCTPAAVVAELDGREHTGNADHAQAAEALVHDLARAAPPAGAVVPHYVAIIRELAYLRRRATVRPEGLPPVPMRGFLIDEDDS